jgi:hypothetical protein
MATPDFISALGSGNLAAYESSPTSPSPIVPASVSGGAGSNNSGWLSGLSDIFQSVGVAVGSGLRGANTPSVTPGSGWVYNSATGQYYNPVTGQALTATGTLTSAGIGSSSLLSNPIVLIFIAIVAFLFLRKRA